jgi:hypothetical protein
MFDETIIGLNMDFVSFVFRFSYNYLRIHSRSVCLNPYAATGKRGFRTPNSTPQSSFSGS